MTEKAPAEKGDRFVSLSTGSEVEIECMSHGVGADKTWVARVNLDGVQTWLTCSKDGIKGYRRKA